MTAADRVLVLMYHRVGNASNDWEARYCVSPQGFAKHMRALAASGYRAVPDRALVSWLSGGPPLPTGAFVLTFDDGFRGVREHALPVLESLGWPFTVFLVSDLLGGDDVWTRPSNPGGSTHPLLNAAEILDMQHRGCSFHSHTRSHASLPQLDDKALTEELTGSRQTLSKLLGHGVDFLAYPFGHRDERVDGATRAAGYQAAFSVQPGFNRRDVDPYCIRRLEVFGTDTSSMLMRKMRLGSNDGTLRNAIGYYWNRVTARLNRKTA
jgi:peptidoglycan/xylan/chitin deacetylase (PgdA/CDA1 family)